MVEHRQTVLLQAITWIEAIGSCPGKHRLNLRAGKESVPPLLSTYMHTHSYCNV